MKIKNSGITLIALTITIVVLLILAGVSISMLLGDNSIINKSKEAKEATNKQTAIDIINLKINNVQIEAYTKSEIVSMLQELADNLYNDNEIEYVSLESNTSESNKITVGDANSIFTKLKDYPYEFEINSSLKIESINGTKLDNTLNPPTNITSSNINFYVPDDKNACKIPKGVYQAYIICATSTTSIPLSIQISGDTILNQEEISSTSHVDYFDGYPSRTTIIVFKLELSGEAGTINIEANNGSSARSWAPILAY